MIVQKVLTERFDRHDLNFAERRFDFRKLHCNGMPRAQTSNLLEALFTKQCVDSAVLFERYSQLVHSPKTAGTGFEREDFFRLVR